MGAPIESSQTWDLPTIFGREHPTFQLNILGAPSISSNAWEHPAIFGGSAGSTHNVMETPRWQIGSSQNIFSIEFIGKFHYFLIWSQWVVDICCSATGNGRFCCQSRKAMSALPCIHFFPHLSQNVFCSLGNKKVHEADFILVPKESGTFTKSTLIQVPTFEILKVDSLLLPVHEANFILVPKNSGTFTKSTLIQVPTFEIIKVDSLLLPVHEANFILVPENSGTFAKSTLIQVPTFEILEVDSLLLPFQDAAKIGWKHTPLVKVLVPVYHVLLPLGLTLSRSQDLYLPVEQRALFLIVLKSELDARNVCLLSSIGVLLTL
jgi:hypothetical protein